MSHPDGDGWGKYVIPHVEYLKELIEQGKLRASGPAIGTALRTGLLIFSVQDRAELDALIAADPFSIEGLITELNIIEWNPMFGVFAQDAATYSPVQ
jgi:hypothetical protein